MPNKTNKAIHSRPLILLMGALSFCLASIATAAEPPPPPPTQISEALEVTGPETAANTAEATTPPAPPTEEVISNGIPFPLVCSIGKLMAIEPAKVTDYNYRTLLMVEKVDNRLYVSPLGRSNYSADFRTAFLGEYQMLIELPDRILGQQPEQRVGSMLGLSLENDNVVAALSVQSKGGLFGGVGVCQTFKEPTLP